MAVEITETPRHTLTVSEQNWQLKLSTSGVAELPDDATFENVTVNSLLTANHIHGNIAGQLYAHVRIGEQNGVVKGDPVYVSSFHDGDHSQPIVSKAQANDPNKMPAIGIMDDTYANNDSGANCVISGLIEDVDTDGFGVNSPIYVGPTGGFTATKPTTNPQQVGICSRDNQNNGSFVVTAQSVKPNQDLNTDSDVEFSDVTVTGSIFGDTTTPKIVLSNAGGSQLVYGTSVLNNGGSLTFSSGGSEKFRVNSSGGVSIGGVIPATKFHVLGTSRLLSNNGGDNSLELGRNDNTYLWRVNHAGNDLRFFNTEGTGFDIVFGVDSGATRYDNKVGIGNPSPSAKLDVESTESVIAKFDSDVNGLPCSVTINYSGNAGISGGSFITLSHDDGSTTNSAYDSMGGFRIGGRRLSGYTSNAAGLVFTASDNWSSSNTPTSWTLYSKYNLSTTNQTFSFDGNNGNYYFDTVGNVGIGIVAPAQKLDVSGAVKKAVYTVSTLPTPSIGASCYVSDANTTHAAGVGTTVVGGGANFVPVYYNGSNWIIG